MWKQTFLLFLVIFNYSYGQNDAEIKKAIDEIFNVQNKEQISSPHIEETEKCGKGSQKGTHKCVPYYACYPNNKSIASSDEYDGTGLIDNISSNGNYCENYLDVCCKIPSDGVISTQK